MIIKYDVPGNKRKNLAKEIAKWLCLEVKYLGTPSFAYEIGDCRLDSDGVLTINAESDNLFLEKLLEHLENEGYKRVDENPQEIVDSASKIESKNDTSENVGLVVAMPRDFFTNNALQNLRKLVDSKSNLIKKALAIDNLPIEVDEEKISFPWFQDVKSSEESDTYTHFIASLCDMAKKQNRITAKERSVDNEKYAFRCFLLRLGFIGQRYKIARKILLRNFSGSSAFKNVASKEVYSDEISE